MNLNTLQHIGSITRITGSAGEVEISLFSNEFEPEPGIALFFNIDNSGIPFFIREVKKTGNKFRLTFDDIESNADAQKFLNKQLFISSNKSNHTQYKDDSSAFIGYKVIDKNIGEAGIVKGIEEYPAQTILQIEHKGKEILLPITDEFIIKIDRENATLYVSFPEGLTDVYQ